MNKQPCGLIARLLLLSVITLACTTLLAAPKKVEVVNTPDVNVINDANSPVSVTIQGDEQTLVEYRIVGYTTSTFGGPIKTDNDMVVSYAAMHKLCANEVAPNARAAFSAEAVRHVEVLPPVAVVAAWVIPSSLEVVYRPDSADWIAWDPTTGLTLGSGATPGEALGTAQCFRHEGQDSSVVGINLGHNGRLTVHRCEVGEVPIACSAPVAIPISP